MLTQEDIIKLSEALATKKDIRELKTDVDSLRELVQGLVLSIDKLVEFMIDSKEEEIVSRL